MHDRDLRPSDFHYSRLLPHKPGVSLYDSPLRKTCVECGQEFVTRCRVKDRCETCQKRRRLVQQERANARQKARRKAKKACPNP